MKNNIRNETTKNSNLIELEYDSAPLYKRFFAGLIDIFLTVFLTFILTLSSIFIYTNTSLYKTSLISINEIINESNLYIRNNNEYVLVSDFYENNKTFSDLEKKEDLEKRVNHFYISLNCYSDKENFGINLLNDLKIKYGSNCFYLDESTSLIKEKEDVLDKEFASFYIYIINENAIGYLLQNDLYRKETNNIFMIQLILLLISLFFSVLLFYFLIPLFIRRGNKTIGKLIFRFGTLNVYGFSLSIKELILKFLWFFFFEFLLSLLTFFVPLIVSVGMMIFSSSHQNFNEYMSKTYSLSNENKKFYLNYEEYFFDKKKKENK